MNPNDPNVFLLERAAEQLGEALLEIRPTQDVDVICSAITRSDYHQLGSQLRQRGFQEDSRPGAPLCRWCIDDLLLDLMPTQGEILGFSNRWYPPRSGHLPASGAAEWALDSDRDGTGIPGHKAGGLSGSRPGRFPFQSRPGGSDGGRGWPCRPGGRMLTEPA